MPATFRRLLGPLFSVDDSKLEQELVQLRKGEKYTILPTFMDNQDPEQAKANGLKAIADHLDLDCMVGLFASNGPMCLQAIQEANKTGEIRIVAFDTHEETIQGIDVNSNVQ